MTKCEKYPVKAFQNFWPSYVKREFLDCISLMLIASFPEGNDQPVTEVGSYHTFSHGSVAGQVE